MERHFQVLDVGLTLAGQAEIIEPIAFAYRRFERPAAEPRSVRLELGSTRARTLQVGGRRIKRVPGLDPTLELYQQFVRSLMDGIGSHAMLHAGAVVEAGGSALILAAPSGHGKSSFTLELACRGLRFLSDDYAPLDLDSSLVWPYPRAAGIVPRPESPLPGPFREPALGASAVHLLGKALVDVGQVLGEQRLARKPAPLRFVLLLGAGQADRPPSTSWLELASRTDDAEYVEGQLRRTDGVEIAQRAEKPHMMHWLLEVRHERHPTTALSTILDSEKVVYYERLWDSGMDFTIPPEALRIRPREAAERLGQELLNRRGGGQFLARFPGGITELFVKLAGSLRGAACWNVRVGDCRKTADLIEQLLRAA